METLKRFLATLALGVFGTSAASGEDGRHPDIDELFERALSVRYSCDTAMELTVRIQDRRGRERERTLTTLTKHLDGQLHSIGRISDPSFLRGMTVMTIENADRADDMFVYLPELGRTRRVAMARRSDSFLGSDLTYGDLERLRPRDFNIVRNEVVAGSDERLRRIGGIPASSARYAYVEFLIAESDAAILAMAYFARDSEGPERTLEMPRSGMEGVKCRIPTQILVRNVKRGSTTSVTIERLRIDPKIDDRIFSIVTMESGRPLEATTE